MIYFNHLTNNALNTQIFYSNGGTWQVWHKPEGVKHLYIFCLGSGSGGGGGLAAAQGSARRGGGGGAAAAYTQLFTNADQIPNTLYVSVATPSAGGAANSGNGATGSLSYVSVQPNTTAINIVTRSGNTNPTPGAGGAASGSGAGGSAGTAWTGGVLSYGIVTGTAPGTGGNGSAATISLPGADVTITNIVSGGSAGGSTNASTGGFNGGNILSQGFWSAPYLSQGGAGSSAAGGVAGAGSGGLNFNGTLMFSGGAGGGASGNTTGVGADGGNGGFGCGGGGGGSGVTAGRGGDGGAGLVIIVAW